MRNSAGIYEPASAQGWSLRARRENLKRCLWRSGRLLELAAAWGRVDLVLLLVERGLDANSEASAAALRTAQEFASLIEKFTGEKHQISSRSLQKQMDLCTDRLHGFVGRHSESR